MSFLGPATLWPVKLHYFLFFGGLACVMQFLPVYITQLGVDQGALTMIYTILPFTVIVIKPLFGNIADHLQKHKTVFLITLIITGVSYYVILFIPELNHSSSNNGPLNCYRNDETIEICGDQISQCVTNSIVNAHITCNVSCQVNNTMSDMCSENSMCNVSAHRSIQSLVFHQNVSSFSRNDTKNCVQIFTNASDFCDFDSSCSLNCECANDDSDNESSIYFSTNFILLFAMLIISYDGAGLSISLGDTIASDMTDKLGADFGHQRVFGTLGWGLLSIIAGQIFSAMSVGLSKTDYSLGYHMLLVFFVLDFFICMRLTVVQQPKPVKILGNIRKLYTDPSVSIFTAAVFVMGLLTGTLWTFLFIYVEKLQGFSPLLLGLIAGVQCFGGELFFFLFSGWIVKKIGHLYSMSICLACYGVRYIYYSFLVDPWLILPMEVCNGVTFGLFFATLVSFACMKAPPGMTATMQGWLQSVFEGIGVGVGNLISGLLYYHYGGKYMFLILGIFSLAFGIIYTVLVVLIIRCGQTQQQETNSDLELQDPMKNAAANGNASEAEKHELSTSRSIQLAAEETSKTNAC